MTKGEKGMGETLKRVAKECQNDAIWTHMANEEMHEGRISEYKYER